jgi:putative two-component system response regulator
VIDDRPDRTALLVKVLHGAGYRVVEGVSDVRLAIQRFTEFEPDLVVQGLHLSPINGYDLLASMQERVDPSDYLPVLILTSDTSREAKERALAAGAYDFLCRPFTSTEVTLRAANLLHARYMHQELTQRNRHLDELVRRRTEELQHAQQELLEHLAKAAEFRDDDTAEHTRRVCTMVRSIALAMGVEERTADLIANASLLHDIGKIGIQDEILRKPDRLTEQEFEDIKKHTVIGANILAGSRSKVLQMAETIALYHHEAWDGTGYMGVKGSDIPLAGRIVAVADVFDALTNDRPYKQAWPVARAIAEIRRCSGTQFDPEVVDAFLLVVDALWADDAMVA